MTLKLFNNIEPLCFRMFPVEIREYFFIQLRAPVIVFTYTLWVFHNKSNYFLFDISWL